MQAKQIKRGVSVLFLALKSLNLALYAPNPTFFWIFSILRKMLEICINICEHNLYDSL